jgi:hypothetical protein
MPVETELFRWWITDDVTGKMGFEATPSRDRAKFYLLSRTLEGTP